MNINALLEPRHEHRILGLMLLCLHLAIWWDFGGALSRSLMLAHLGLFLMWQPLWSREQRLEITGTATYVLVTLAFIVWLEWWLLTFWLLLLTGFVGGRVNVDRTDRYAFLVALAFLVTEILIGCVPPMVEVAPLPAETQALFIYGVVPIPLGLMFVPGRSSHRKGSPEVDFLYGLNLSLLTTILALGSLLSMFLTDAEYPVAVIQTILGIALFLLALSWLWAPLAGFSGLGQLWERYLQSIGTPFERWLGRLSQLAERGQSPREFLDAAMSQLTELPWVAGVTWNAGGAQGRRGEVTAHAFETTAGSIEVKVFAQWPIGAALLLHGNLLLQLVGHFHTAKEREQELTQRAHLQAIYETGARVTHDIKNLLQSLYAMTSAIEITDDENREELVHMLERQLPHLTQRLQLALDKLQTPQTSAAVLRELSDWWEDLQHRNAAQSIEFNADIADVRANSMIPADFFESVVENLLENARVKRLNEPGIDINVSLVATPSGIRLRVADTGSPVDPEIVRDLFRAPVKSRSGLGIGLFQAARQAEPLGYRLALVEDTPGVCIELVSTSVATRPQAST